MRLRTENSYLVIVMVLGIILIGFTSLQKMPVDILPLFQTPAVQILTFYPGMAVEVMERDITNRLERWTSQANGIARQESKTIVGVSLVKDYFREDIDPNTAMSQVTSLAMSDLFYLPPGTIPPMVMPFDPTASIPLTLLSVSSETLDEKQVYDVAYFSIRNQLSGITGVIAPAVYGGKLRRILVYLDRDRLQARGLSPMDVVQSLRAYNVMIPLGSAKIGATEYQINSNGMVPRVEDLDDFPIKIEAGAPVYVGDVGRAEDSFAIQTNVVHVNGKRQVYIPIYRQPGANTIQVVEGVKNALTRIRSRIPSEINLDVILDQSHYVRQAIHSLSQEAALGAVLAGVMTFLFLGSLRSTFVIFLTIPLSVLAALTGLYFTGDSINALTLGGLALAVGRLVDDSIVVLENIYRHVRMGKPALTAARDATEEVEMPVLVSTVTTIVVFFPVIFLTGMGKFLFSPLSRAVAFSMTASYVLAMTMVPVYCARFYRGLEIGGGQSAKPGVLERAFEAIRDFYTRNLNRILRFPRGIVAVASVLFMASLALYPFLGTELFPQSDAGQLMIRVRAPSGTRIELTEALVTRVEAYLRRQLPQDDVAMIVSNIGVLNDWPAAYTPNSGPSDAFVLVQLTDGRKRSAQQYVSELRASMAGHFPGTEFSFDTGGLLSAALNFGLPSPINVQLEGNDLRVAHPLADQIRRMISEIPGMVDVRIQERLDSPQINIQVDRDKTARLGLTQVDVVKNTVTSLNSSVNFDPSFWIDDRSGNHYFLGAQYPETTVDSLATLEDIPITGPRQNQPVLLKNLATFERGTAPTEVNHLNITRVINVYANVEGRDLGSAAAEIERRLRSIQMPPGYRALLRGEASSMKESFRSLGWGLLLAAALVYLVLVAQFRSFLDPLIIIFAVPLGLMGVIGILLLTRTTLNIQSFLGTIFMVGIAVSNSILLVEFANRLRERGRPLRDAVIDAAATRLRPILITSLAAILGLVPMALELGRGSEANTPLARAVIGGLFVSTILTLVVVPASYLLFKKTRAQAS